MQFSERELREIVDCIDFTNNHLRFLNKIYESRKEDMNRYKFGYLNYMISLRNKIVDELNKKAGEK
jgi:hypothetical protein